MVNTLHVCTTNLGWNPFYIQVGRNYHRGYNTHCDYGEFVEYYYDNISNTLIHDPAKTVELYKNVLNIDSLEENLENIKVSTFEELP